MQVFSFCKDQITQDQFIPSKPNPLEMPLQKNSYKERFNNWIQKEQDTQKEEVQVFSREKVRADSQPTTTNYFQNQKVVEDTQSDNNCNEDEIQMIKKRLDFSRLSSLQN